MPARSSSLESSAAARVGRSTTFVMPTPYSTSDASSYGDKSRGVKPAPCSAGQKRLPGRAKWCPRSAESSDGLIPQKSTSSPGAITSRKGFLLAVALLREHELAGGERGARRRRGIGADCDGLGDRPRDGRGAAVVGDYRDLAIREFDRSRQPRVEARVLQVVQQVLGLVLEAE